MVNKGLEECVARLGGREEVVFEFIYIFEFSSWQSLTLLSMICRKSLAELNEKISIIIFDI